MYWNLPASNSAIARFLYDAMDLPRQRPRQWK
jgi:hypothetical protein